ITNVADGAKATDAVNVRQLEYAVNNIDLADPDFGNGVIADLQDQINDNLTQYVSIKDDDNAKGNKGNDGAQGVDSIAIGPDANTGANAENATAIGYKTTADGSASVVLG